ncbi:MAG TPA: dihydroneopterin aldolase [Acidimicrobiales bacterium]|nr:dihydroneopterin aldolase [Acidimicrobiales bacterium]
MDLIQLRGLRVVGVHGVLPEERERAQPFEVDLDIETDLSSAGASDHLDDTLDYGALTAIAERVVAEESYGLLERVAARVAEALLDADERVASVTVTVWKLRPPVPMQLDRAGVRITRRRQAGG